MRTISSRGKSPQSTPIYETYEMQRLREIDAERLVLQNEHALLYRTCENIAMWNVAMVGGFQGYVVVVGFRYDASVAVGSLANLRYVYDGLGPKLRLSSYVSSHPEVELHQLERGLPRAEIAVEPLLRELECVRRELRRLARMRRAFDTYAPGGTAYRQLVRKAAQQGMTRYHLRPSKRRTHAS